MGQVRLRPVLKHGAKPPDDTRMSRLADAEIVVVGSGPHPGPDAVAVAREIASRCDPQRHGGVALLAHVPDPAVARPDHPVPEHWVGPLLRSWAERGLDWPQLAGALAAVRDYAASAFGAAGLAAGGVRQARGRVRLGRGGQLFLDGADGSTERLSPNRIVLATGATRTRPDIPGLAEVRTHPGDHTWASLLDRPQAPESVVVLGAGPFGCELAQGLVRLGLGVTLIERGPRVLPDAPAAVAGQVAAALAADGVRMVLGAGAVKVAPTLDGGAWVGTEGGSDVAAQALVLATDRRPRTAGLGLAEAGIELAPDGGARLDERLRTSQPAVLASGEVTGLQAYGCAPGPMARVVAANVTGSADGALGRRQGLRWSAPVPALVIRTDPEVVLIGDLDGAPSAALAGAADGPAPGSSVRVVVARAARAWTGPGAAGKHVVVAAAMVGRGAAEAAGQLVLAVNAGLPVASLIDVQVADGTWASALQGCLSGIVARA
jgi:pyruvate/2-oxoglutarate dehydrogenase complex dihydrolipoamide dehydrogenase (E3) component